MAFAPKDGYGVPAMLGVYNGHVVPVKVDENGKIYIVGSTSAVAYERYELLQVLTIDLSTQRDKELVHIAFDSFAVGNVNGSFSIYLDMQEENKKITIDKCLSMNVSASSIYISNAVQTGNAELWFFKIKE
jgi:hypothetical protein